jgi:hypothetical protein
VEARNTGIRVSTEDERRDDARDGTLPIMVIKRDVDEDRCGTHKASGGRFTPVGCLTLAELPGLGLKVGLVHFKRHSGFS